MGDDESIVILLTTKSDDSNITTDALPGVKMNKEPSPWIVNGTALEDMFKDAELN